MQIFEITSSFQLYMCSYLHMIELCGEVIRLVGGVR